MIYSDVAVIIPSRIGSTRLPKKPLAKIGDKIMIEHVVNNLAQLNFPHLFVATDDKEIQNILEQKNINVIMTKPECESGTDRVHEALQSLPNTREINYVVNVQGDMPFINGTVILDLIERLKNSDFDIMTPAVKVGFDIINSESNVKIAIDPNNKALYFSRSLIPHGAKEFLYHVGIYAFKKAALEKFVTLEQTANEKLEKLEQLRALDNGMKIGVCFCDDIPISVDTTEDLEKARKWYNSM